MDNAYELLEVQRDASPIDIKKAFRRLGREHHPDRNPDDSDAEARFKELNAAYQILSDPLRRKLYDRDHPKGVASPRRNSSLQDHLWEGELIEHIRRGRVWEILPGEHHEGDELIIGGRRYSLDPDFYNLQTK